MLAPWAAAAALATVYLTTMCRDLYWYDSAELAIAAIQPGLGHPPGQPLYTLVGWLMSFVAHGHPLFGVNMLSALCAAMCAVPAMAMVTRLNVSLAGRGAWLSAAVLVGLGFNDAVWDTATRIEVYSLATLLALTQLAHLMATLDRLENDGSHGFTGSTGRGAVAAWMKRHAEVDWLLGGLLMGLTFSVHPYIAIFMAVASAFMAAGPLLRTRPKRPARSASFLIIGAAFGLLPHAWIPLSTSLDGHLVWGDPSSISRFLFYVTGVDYSHNRASVLGTGAHALHFIGWLTQRGLLPVYAGGALAWWMGRTDRPGLGARCAPLVIRALGIVMIGRIGNYRPEIPDFLGYLLPATWLAGVGLSAVAARAQVQLSNRASRLLVAALVVTWIALNAFLPPSVATRSRSDNRMARQLSSGILQDAPHDAIVLVSSDHILFPLLYLVEVEGTRTDLVIIAHGWGSSSWYWEHLASKHPDLAPWDKNAPGRDERIKRFLADNPSRPVIAENLGLASLGTGIIIREGFTLRTGGVSDKVDPLAGAMKHEWARSRLSRWIADRAAPGTQDRLVLSFIATAWGRDEQAGGSPGQAVLDYLAGAPADVEIALPADLMVRDSWSMPLPSSIEPAPYRLLSSPEYNLFLAGRLLFHHRDGKKTGQTLIEIASSRGCVEAMAWLADHHASS